MDEVLFRSSQKLEHLQVQLSLAATQSRDVLKQCSQNSKSVILQAWHSSYLEQAKNSIHSLWQYVIKLGNEVRQHLWQRVDLERLYYSLAKVFWDKWTKRDLYFLCAGFIGGTVVGVIFAISMKKNDSVIRYMQAIQTVNYMGTESATVVENAKAPSDCNEDEVVISVKAASAHIIDAQICSGYGRFLRRILQRIYTKHPTNGLPVTLGRDCSGIIVDIGSNVKRLEIGDEVWLAVPFWREGTMSQSVIVPEFLVGRKPKNVGYEGACSLPYAGTLVLNALKGLEVKQENMKNKRCLVFDGCTPMGCILIQILKHWKATISTTCTQRAVPVVKALGATDIIVLPNSMKTDNEKLQSQEEALSTSRKELELREKFDFIFITKTYYLNNIEEFCTGKVASTMPKALPSDNYGLLNGSIVQSYIWLKSILEKILGLSLNDYDEGHMCYTSLDQLAEMVENGTLQTVVDKVLQPQDIEVALNHIQSLDSIGSTVITFR